VSKYHIEITHSAEKELHKYPVKLQDRFSDAILGLGDNPRPFGSKKLFNSNNYRTRIGNYRIIYVVDDDRKIVKILDLGHRKDIYR